METSLQISRECIDRDEHAPHRAVAGLWSRIVSTGAGRLIAFFAVVVVALFATDFLIDAGLKRVTTSDFGEFNRIVNGTINAGILISGSSRALNDYDPRVISTATGVSAWNIGIDGSQTDMQLAMLKTYLNHNRAPSVLIHNLDSFAFVTSKAGVAFPDWYLPYLNEPPLYDALVAVDPEWWKAKHLPLYGYAVEDMRFSWTLGLAALAGWTPKQDRFNGFAPRNAAWSEDFEHFKRSNPGGVQFPVESEGIRQLDELLDTMTERGTRVVLVYAPVYWEMQNLEIGRAEIFRRFSEMASRHGARLWDYSNSPISRRRDYFVNSQHLNADGAAAFSASLAERLVRSTWLDRASQLRETPALIEQ